MVEGGLLVARVLGGFNGPSFLSTALTFSTALFLFAEKASPYASCPTESVSEISSTDSRRLLETRGAMGLELLRVRDSISRCSGLLASNKALNFLSGGSAIVSSIPMENACDSEPD